MKTSIRIIQLAITFFCLNVYAQHFSLVYVDIRLVGSDSITVTVEADAQDLKNTVQVFPYFDRATGKGWESFRLYETKIEAYLQQKLILKADAKRVYLKVIKWKPSGKNREDGFDTVSIHAGNHSITFGGKIPSGTKALILQGEFWLERPELTADTPPTIEYHLFEGNLPLRRIWSITERKVSFPISPDSLAVMRQKPLPPLSPRIPMDHSTHDH